MGRSPLLSIAANPPFAANPVAREAKSTTRNAPLDAARLLAAAAIPDDAEYAKRRHDGHEAGQ